MTQKVSHVVQRFKTIVALTVERSGTFSAFIVTLRESRMPPYIAMLYWLQEDVWATSSLRHIARPSG
jgi:hypothetical protein